MLPTDIFSILYTWPKLNQMLYLGSKWILWHKIISNPYLLVYTSAFKLISCALNWRNTNRPEYYYILCYYILRYFCVFAVCVKSYYILRYGCYYILRRKLLHFALLLHFVAKVITFCVTITFCVSYYNMWRNTLQLFE